MANFSLLADTMYNWPLVTVVMLFGLLLLAGAIALMVAMFLSRQPIARSIAGFVLVSGLLFVTVFAIALFGQAKEPNDLVGDALSRARNANGGSRPSVGWDVANELAGSEQTQYSSPTVAAMALASRIMPDLEEIIVQRKAKGESPTIEVVAVQGMDEIDMVKLADAFSQSLRSALPEDVTVVERGAGNEANAGVPIRIEIGVFTFTTTRHSQRKIEYSGNVDAKIRSHGKQATCAFTLTPWLESLQEYSDRHPDGVFVVARSGDRMSTAAKAHRGAVSDAIGRLELSSNRKDSELANLIERNELEVDRYSQYVRDGAGDYWREAILLDLSANQIVAATSPTRLSAFMKRVGGFLGLVVVTFAMFGLLKMLTSRKSNVQIATLVVVGTTLLVVGSMVSIVKVRSRSSTTIELPADVAAPLSRPSK